MKTPAAAPSAVGSDALETEPLLLEKLGVRFRPPRNCVMRVDGASGAQQWTVTERVEHPRFVLRFSRFVATQESSSPAERMDEYVAAMTTPGADDAQRVFVLRERREFTMASVPAGLLYATIRERDDLSAVRGYLLLQLSPQQFIVVSIWMAEDDYAAVAPLLERSFQTIELLTREEAASARLARLAEGDEFLRHLDEESLRTALDPVPEEGALPKARLYRLASKALDGTVREVGYLTVRVLDAPQGCANPTRDIPLAGPRVWADDEEERGMLVLVNMRTLLDEKGTAVADSDARYWVRWDRQREFWTSRTTKRSGKKVQSSTQLGVRAAPSAGRLRPLLEVSDARQGTSTAETPLRQFAPPRTAFISLAEAMVLPRLLAREGRPGDYAFNWFNPQLDKPAQRRDVLRKTETGFMLETQGSLESPLLTEILGPRGELLRLDGDDGSVAELIEPEALMTLWKQKGLPTT